ncbi:Phosphoinositide 3-kinase regulatory subunit 4 [Cytospora mali]|uniref:non-specific serine/threonine protein kinase n=1 Tax=Cytospora mali TaxID=578113 RepID=A0A194USX9_CYTMA|nr:Phosphoinositide 3-kinase regulatory subunit 4 [Valsa mali var. pyri (nom. inval.)]
MGQGFSVTTPSAGAAGIDVPELADLVYEKATGSARFMKSIRARHHDGVVLVKVFIKPYTPMSLDKYRQMIIYQRQILSEIPNALGYQRIVETETNGYLVRQYLYNSLYDRLSTRPFLEDIEKKWISFQLLCALRDCHARDIYHGDIKAENTLVTSWNWLYLTDFSSSLKPVTLPDDNPTDFSYFFDTSSRRTCYIAPERFVAPGKEQGSETKLTWAMDVFSAGCVIAELFLESPIFSLSQLFKYRKGEYDPVISHVSRIPDRDIRELVSHMIQLDPQKRYSAEQYLEFWRKKAFPDYFFTFMHQYMEVITDPSSGQYPSSGTTKNLGEADERIDRVFLDFDKISYFLGYQNDSRGSESTQLSPRLGLGHFPVHLNIPNNEYAVSGDVQPAADDGTLIFLTLVVSSLRNTARAASKVRACDVLLAFAERLTDEAKLDRVLPYLIALLNDKADIVVITSIRTITQLLALVKSVNPVNAHVFLEYILPRMQIALYGTNSLPGPLVRATYASCIGSLATTAQRFLQMSSTLKAAGTIATTDPDVESGSQPDATFDGLFDEAQQELVELFEAHTKSLIEDADPYVRRAFLSSVPELCLFFGTAESNDIILTHLNTYLNDRDWMLKCAFFETIVGIAAFMGSVSLEEFMLPLMIQALTDTEEHVVQGALHSLAQLANLGLLSKPRLWELTDVVSRFSMHPNIWIRESAADFIAAAAKYLSPADVKCILIPLISPYLKTTIMPTEISELTLLDTLKKPLSRLRNLGLSPNDEFKLLALREFIWRLSQIKTRDSATNNINSELNSIINLRTLGATVQTVMFDEETPKKPIGVDDVDANAPRTIADALMDASMSIDDPIGKRKRAAMNTHRGRLSNQIQLSPSPDYRRPLEDVLSSPRNDSPHGGSRLSLLGPIDGGESDAAGPAKRTLRHTPSAITLLNRKDSNKAIAEIGTTDANATGRVEGLFSPTTPSRQSIAEGDVGELDSLRRLNYNHNYPGNDPHILKMLDSMYVDNYPHDIAEFGPLVTPITRRKVNKTANGQVAEGWKPTGKMMATFSEHVGAVNRVVVSPDHVFFITGGDDGTVKVWDTARLERNIAHRSRQTHRHAPGAKVLSLCFIENTHCFISCASDGSVHVVKVETAFASGTTRYGKLRLLREYQLPDDEFAVWCEHFKQETNSVMVIATNRSRILGIDLRTMSLLYVLENPVHHGTPMCFCIDRKRNWLCLGTSHGVLDLWDLRFKMRLKGWGVPGKSAIYRLCIHPIKGRGKWVCVSGGTGQGEVTVWDLEKTLCREIYRVGGNKEGPKGYSPWEVDEDRPEGMLGRFATNIEPTATGNADRGVRAMVVGSGSLEGSDQRDVRHAFILTGGSDKKLRFWDLTRIENSTVFSGLQLDEGKPTYSASHPTTAMTLNTERLPRGQTSSSSNDGDGRRGSSRRANGAGAGTGGRPTRSTVISVQQQQLLKAHLDSILDITLLESPYTMTISVDRSGVVYVFQ